VACFALTQRSRAATAEAILLLVDERRDAEEIATELRRKGVPVDVHEMVSPPAPPPPKTLLG
jgi:ATP-dependent exoDNAse (exonuclease V) beta subunit